MRVMTECSFSQSLRRAYIAGHLARRDVRAAAAEDPQRGDVAVGQAAWLLGTGFGFAVINETGKVLDAQALAKRHMAFLNLRDQAARVLA